jgi:hypothetical protein
MLLPMPGAILDFPSLSFQVPICGFAAKHATVAANDKAVTTAAIRVFICAGDSGRNAVTRQYQFQNCLRRRQCYPFRFVLKNPRQTRAAIHGDDDRNVPFQ